MRTRWLCTPRLVALAVASLLPACAEDRGDQDPPTAQDSEGDDDDQNNVCIEQCEPLEQDCGRSMTCLPDQPGFSCQHLWAASDGGRRGLHDACELGSQLCDVGLVCLQAAVPGCTGGSGCCVAICDMTDPQCTDGTSCFPFFEASAMCFEDIGACVLS